MEERGSQCKVQKMEAKAVFGTSSDIRNETE